jgi:hypothetical protein
LIHPALNSDFAVIAVVYGLYLFDSISRGRLGEVSIAFGWHPKYFFTDTPFSFGDRAFSFEKLFRPWRCVVREPLGLAAPWLKPRSSQLRYIALLNRSMLPVTILALYNGLLLLVVFPVLVIFTGLSSALVSLAPLVYLNIVAILLSIYFSPARKRLSRKSWLTFYSDFFLCPPYSINACSRVFAQYRIPFKLLDFMLHVEKERPFSVPLQPMVDFLQFHGADEGMSGKADPLQVAIKSSLDKRYGA